jgi:hypothetical protein
LNVKSINCHYKFSSLFSAASQDDKILLFGGIVSYNNVLNDLAELNLSQLILNSKGRDCVNCTENNRKNEGIKYISSIVI